jgi:hypothetical protein
MMSTLVDLNLAIRTIERCWLSWEEWQASRNMPGDRKAIDTLYVAMRRRKYYIAACPFSVIVSLACES